MTAKQRNAKKRQARSAVPAAETAPPIPERQLPTLIEQVAESMEMKTLMAHAYICMANRDAWQQELLATNQKILALAQQRQAPG